MLHTIQADFYRLFRSKGFLDHRSHSRSQHPVWSHLWSYRPRRRQYGIQITPSNRSLDGL